MKTKERSPERNMTPSTLAPAPAPAPPESSTTRDLWTDLAGGATPRLPRNLTHAAATSHTNTTGHADADLPVLPPMIDTDPGTRRDGAPLIGSTRTGTGTGFMLNTGRRVRSKDPSQSILINLHYPYKLII